VTLTPTPMQLAIQLAKTARGFSSPNPSVGAVIVNDGATIGLGATGPVGGPHAEVVAIHMAGELARGATMYVTLEPHSFYGHTPPCTDAIITAGITTVHVATLDPNPKVFQQGVIQLQQAGIHVVVGEESIAAKELIAPFAHWLGTNTPLATAKMAMSLDGKIATYTGQSQWITGIEARQIGHQLRRSHDAILVGIGTVLADDPLLTTRITGGIEATIWHPLRVIVDSRGRMPSTAAMLAPSTPGHTLIVTTSNSTPEWRAAMTAAGAEVEITPATATELVDLTALWSVLGTRGCLSVLIEGGSSVLGSAFAAKLVQRVEAFVAPLIIGGNAAIGPVGNPGFATLDTAVRLQWTGYRQVGADIWLSGSVTDS